MKEPTKYKLLSAGRHYTGLHRQGGGEPDHVELRIQVGTSARARVAFIPLTEDLALETAEHLLRAVKALRRHAGLEAAS